MSTQRASSPESDVVRFFLEGEPSTVLTVFHIVRGILESRGVFKPEPAPRPLRRSPARRAPQRSLLDDTVHQPPTQ